MLWQLLALNLIAGASSITFMTPTDLKDAQESIIFDKIFTGHLVITIYSRKAISHILSIWR